MKKVVALTGAGISAESGLKTFRDSDGLWENHNVYDVATPEAWEKNPELVQRFYNARRKQLQEVQPNEGHLGLKKLEQHFQVDIITQNVDDLHERAGSSNVLHLHGELKKVRSTIDPNLVHELKGWELKIGDTCAKGSQLRPHIVWFGEQVPMLEPASKIVSKADVLLIEGTSLNVYPAASLYEYTNSDCPIYVVDPSDVAISHPRFTFIKEKASTGVTKVIEELLKM